MVWCPIPFSPVSPQVGKARSGAASLIVWERRHVCCCEQCQVPETVEHVVMDCSVYEAEREVMRSQIRDLGVQDMTLICLLKMGDRRVVKILLVFLRASGLFDRV